MIGWILAAALLQAASPAATCAYTGGAASVAVPGRPFVAQPSQDGCRLFVPLARGNGSALAVLRNDGGAFVLDHVVALRGEAGGAALSPDGARLAVTLGGEVALLDTAALAAGGEATPRFVSFGAGAGAIQAAFSRDGSLLFVSLERQQALAVIDVAKAASGAGAVAVIGRVPQGRAPVGLALSPGGRILYAVSEIAGGRLGEAERCPAEQGGGGEHGAGAVTVVDVERARRDPAHALAGAVVAGCNPVRVAVSADGASVWVTARGDGRLLRFNAADLALGAAPVAVVKVGKAPVGLALTPDGATIWVSDSDRFARGAGSLAAVDVAGARVRETRSAAGGFPRDLRMLPDGRTLVAALYDGQAVQFVPAPPATPTPRP